MMPSEYDPLLPQTAPSPEISGYGYSKSKQTQPEIVEDQQDDEDTDPTASPDPSSGGASPLSTLIGIFTFVVAVGFLFATFMSGSVSEPSDRPLPGGGGGGSHQSPPTLSDRVAKILDGTPLIGLENFLC
jgi:hypothetical protein